jgi:2-polyprenyl-6-methoxyphenol hydroxylase-like FAD-dependent oxidoreductase
MSEAPLRIAVIGAGIGGLTAALSLRQAGFDVDLYEQAPALTHIGGGINMGPNAARVLFRLGLRGAVARGRVPDWHASAALG